MSPRVGVDERKVSMGRNGEDSESIRTRTVRPLVKPTATRSL